MATVLRNISKLAVCPSIAKSQSDCGEIERAALVWDEESILWVGAESDLPSEFNRAVELDARGYVVIPGLIDCHTHLCFAGWRADEFAEKLRGGSYAEIAARGGGIQSTVTKTRAADKSDLIERARNFLWKMAQLGVTTVEAKSGYGLSIDSEIKQLEVYQALQKLQPLTIVPTFLGAHTVPIEFRVARERYIELIINEMIPQVAERGLAKFCDAFVESVAFSVAEAEQIFRAAIQHGLIPKVHADQLTSCGGAELAVKVGAASADHLEFISDRAIKQMAESETVAVLLPIASLYLRAAPVEGRRLLNHGVKVAIATDFNPGSAPSYDLPLALMLACTQSRLTPAEALMGATSIAAKALRLSDRGSLEVGKRADFALLDVESVESWIYHFRPNACVMTVKDGKTIYQA